MAKRNDALIARAYEEALIDTMAEDAEMDADAIATELEACGYSSKEAERLAARPWKR